jgi:hypothetical protein
LRLYFSFVKSKFHYFESITGGSNIDAAQTDACVSMIKRWSSINNQLDSIMISFTSASDALTLPLSQTRVSIRNRFVSLMRKSSSLSSFASTPGQAEVSIDPSDSFCNLANTSLTKSGSSTSFLNCSALSLIQKLAINQVAVVGSNGKQSNIESSQTVTVSYFQSTNQALNVQGLTSPISIWIPRTSNVTVGPYQLINAHSLSTVKCVDEDQFLQNSFTISGPNSIHIQFKPSSSNIKMGYLVLLTFGSAPKLNSTYSRYDLWQLYCPNDTTTQQGDSFYLFFANTSTVNGYTGFVGLAMRELTRDEMATYCPNDINKYSSSVPPLPNSAATLSNQTSSNSTGCKMITNNFYLRVYLSGCYYMDTLTGSYKTDGTEVLPDTNVYSTHCQVTHCTEFAGGFIVLPTRINFDEVFASASIDKNPIIYATVFTIVGLYVVLAVLCRIFDMRDKSKKGVTFLNGNRTENLYEIIVFTGNRRNAGTDSKVSMMINGQDENSHVIQLYDSARKSFRRGGVDTFIISTEL